MKVKNLLYSFLLIAFNVYAQEPADNIPDDVGIISELVEISFAPIRVNLLVVNQNEQIEKYHAEFIPIDNDGAGHRIYAGGRISIDRKGALTNPILVTFIFEGNNNEMAATPVKSWNLNSINRNTKSIIELSKGKEIIKEKITAAQAQMAELERRSLELRNIVSQIAGVEEIVKLKNELAATKARITDLKADKERLAKLSEAAKEKAEIDDIDILRRELNVHLTEAAKATAMADRLSKRKQKAAMQSIQEKIAVIKETANEDPKALARLALELRAERKKLEMRLGERTQTGSEESEF